MKPKILLCFEYGTLNGGEFSMLAVLERLISGPFELLAAAPRSGPLTERLVQCGIEVQPLTLRDTRDCKRPIDQIDTHLMELITQVAPDLVHANSLAMGRMVGRIAPQIGLPCTTHLRDIIKLSHRAIQDLNQNTGLVAVSQATRQFHVNQGIDPDKVQVIYNGVDSNIFQPRPATGTLKQQLRLPPDAVLLANIGQICLRKGQVLLARAAVDLIRSHPQLYVLFIGERHSQKQESLDYENRIRTIFHQAQLDEHVLCLGFREDVVNLLNEIDLLVHAAHQEPLGRVLLEAAACGQVIVATDVGGTAEILTDHVSARLVPSNSIDELKAAIEHLLSHPEDRLRLGQHARQQALKKFSLDTAAAQTRKFWLAKLTA